jgi:RNA polymerase sigma-70 factor (ECF subfamily)
MKEIELKNGLKNGDEIAYRVLFNKYYGWLCNYIFKLCNNYSLSEDLVQEIMVKLWENRNSIEIKTSLKSYLFKSCHNQFLQHIRKEKVKLDFIESLRWDVLYEVYNEDDILEEKVNRLHKIINELPPRCKAIFMKSKFEKKKYKEIAEDMNISIKTVENQMSKALHYLRDHASSLFL